MNDLELICNSLVNIIYEDKKSNDEINYLAKKVQGLAYATKLIYGVLENKIYLDYMIGKLSKVKIKKIHKNVLTILEMGLYNIHFLATKDYAIVDKLVELCKKKNKRSANFVNAILRNFIRNEEDLAKIYIKDDIKALSIRYSMPEEISRYIYENYGMAYTKNFLRYTNDEARLSIRINSLKTDRESLKKRLEALGYELSLSKISDRALIIHNPSGLANSLEFKEGLFTIQQEASMKTVEVLNPKKNSRILDICAAPGTKASYLAEYTSNTGKIIANDISANKLCLIKENIERLALTNIEIKSFDGSVFNKEYEKSFDYILVDAPCSGLGVMARKPEIRYNRSLDDIRTLSILQRKILDTSIRYLKDGGELVYSTCTLGPIENLDNFNYLKGHEQLELVQVEGKDYIEFVCFEDKTDGFFISKFKKKNYDENTK